MKLQVYLDVNFMVNFSMDYLFFQIINQAVHKNIRRTRIALTSLFGGAVGVFYTLIDIELTRSQMISKGISMLIKLFIMAVSFEILYFMAFGREGWKEKLRSIGYFLLILFLYAGFHSLILRGSQSTILLLMITGFLFLMLLPVFFGAVNGMKEEINDFVQVSFELSGTRIIGKGFIDSGNHLREPVSQSPVCIVEKSWLEKFLPEEEIGHIFSTEVEYHSLGSPQGKLMAAGLKELAIKQKGRTSLYHDIFLAVYPGTLSSDFQILLNGSLRP